MKEITLNEMKKIELNMLEYIDDLCRNNNIEYCLIAGSLIGAVRHKGMIPWDDDIDIILKRDEYNKLINLLKSDTNNQFCLMDHSIQKDYFFPFAKLIDTRTSVEEQNFIKINNYGVFVDIFALDVLPNDANKRSKRYKKQKKIQRQIFYYENNKFYEKNIIKKIMKIIYKRYCRIIGIDSILKKYNEVCTKYNNTDGEYTISNWPLYKEDQEIQKKENFDKMIDAEFDGLKVRIPEKYDEILTTTFGDYMTPPPPEKRYAHNMKAYWRE